MIRMQAIAVSAQLTNVLDDYNLAVLLIAGILRFDVLLNIIQCPTFLYKFLAIIFLRT